MGTSRRKNNRNKEEADEDKGSSSSPSPSSSSSSTSSKSAPKRPRILDVRHLPSLFPRVSDIQVSKAVKNPSNRPVLIKFLVTSVCMLVLPIVLWYCVYHHEDFGDKQARSLYATISAASLTLLIAIAYTVSAIYE
eukprot:TRINITY_DN103_c1_g2_i2.p2 TRINITY_DN103_c1_g2~~TRINITY_DN103_c1_g2_i2.p2  ORF type:complete len:136 (+),score=55.99 TRINITY_DN103_c1_g2_i2:258-665(+)